MAESAYAVVSKTIGSNPVWVQVPLKPPDRSSPLPSPKINAMEENLEVGKAGYVERIAEFLHLIFRSQERGRRGRIFSFAT